MAWKYDITISDREGWKYFTMGTANLEPNGEVIIQFLAGREDGIIDDFYVEHASWLTLSSRDGGLTWNDTQRNWFPGHFPLKLKDGTWIEILEKHFLRSHKEHRARLQQLGIDHVWRDDALFIYDLYPARMADELRRKGLAVWDIEHVGGSRCVPSGTVAAIEPGLIARSSSDEGKTWQVRPIEGLPPRLSRLFNHMNRGVVLNDDTILISFNAKEQISFSNSDSDHQFVVGVLRSADRGITWKLIPIARGPTEAEFVVLPSHRILALLRHHQCILKSFSDDGGLTWSQPEETPMWGFPLHALVLHSGNILCTYAYRRHPAGVRVCLSLDEGRTWNIQNEKILRCDSLPTHWIGGPVSVQLSDDSILSIYTVPRIGRPKPGDCVEADQTLLLHPPHHTYLAASRFTEDYVNTSQA